MDRMMHQQHEPVAPHVDHKMSGAHPSHDRHAGHSVAMFQVLVELRAHNPSSRLVDGCSTLA
jgi:hypothetical protein